MRVSFAICMVALVSVFVLEAQIVTDGLVSYYTLDEADIVDGTVRDAFGNNDGTIVGNPTAIEGHLGEALDFGGGPDCVVLPSIMAIGENPVTYETWFWKTSRNDWQYLMSNKSDFNDHFFRLGFNENTGQIRFYSEQENNIRLAWVTAEDYSDGEWRHLAAIRDGDKGKVYVDGVLIKEDTAMDGDLGGELTGWYLAQDGNTNGYFVGAMDEVRIYNRALTDQEVQQNFESRGMAAVEGRDKLSVTWGVIKEGSL